MSESTAELIPVAVAPTETPEVLPPVQVAATKLNLRELLNSIGKEGAVKILKERPVTLWLPDGSQSPLTVKELTKNQYDKLLVYTTRDMPDVPMIEQRYTLARRDPLTGVVKPAGSYSEQNPNDPHYIAATQRWFNDTAVLFGLFAAAADFGIDLTLKGVDLMAHLDEIVAEISNNLPTPTLLDIAYEASLVNRGIPIAEQLIGAVEAHRAMAVIDDFERTGGTD